MTGLTDAVQTLARKKSFLFKGNPMKFQIALFAAAALVAAGCAKKDEPVDTTPSQPPQTTDRGDPNANIDRGPVPGTEADFVENAGDRVFYELDSYQLDSEGRATLDRQAAWLQEYPNVTVLVGGHADERGTREYNLALAARRANSAKDYLVSRGIDPSRLSTVSYGEERPVCSASSQECWALNRNATSNIVSGAVSS
nr:peptidoglycan-associated lipoprotein Pal [Euryhalocaulis caribicus]